SPVAAVPARCPSSDPPAKPADRSLPAPSSLRRSRASFTGTRSFACLREARLDRIAVDAAVLEIELVGPFLDVADRVARDEPERDRLAAPAVLLARPRLREVGVRGLDGAGVLERLAFPLPAKNLVDHAASTTSRTHCSRSRKPRRKASRSSVFGPWPVTTCLSSAQSGSVYSQTPSSRFRSFGSGTVSPSSQICGT